MIEQQQPVKNFDQGADQQPTMENFATAPLKPIMEEQDTAMKDAAWKPIMEGVLGEDTVMEDVADKKQMEDDKKQLMEDVDDKKQLTEDVDDKKAVIVKDEDRAQLMEDVVRAGLYAGGSAPVDPVKWWKAKEVGRATEAAER